METPYLSHITTKDYEDTYEPSEDSFLMLDALEADLPFIEKNTPRTVIEIGSGSGITITALSKKLGTKSFCFATDINSKALKTTKKTAVLNETKVECITMDLFTNFRGRVFDLVIFNPPYVVTESDEIYGRGIERSWAGGKKGREVIDRFLNMLPFVLAENGFCYLIVIQENDPDDICGVMEDRGFCTKVVCERKIRGEFLKVLRFSQKNS